ncbi:MAG: hypothetical protein AAF382_14585 [Pseudomonadota bacterium]
MGVFYVTLCVKVVQPDKLQQFLSVSDDHGFVGPMESDWVAVCSKTLDHQDQEVIDTYGELISEHLGAPVVAFLNHDEAILSVDTYMDGRGQTQYNSCPGYFFDDPNTNDLKPRLKSPDALVSIVSPERRVAFQIALMIGAQDTLDLHARIAEALELPEYSLEFWYRDIKRQNVQSHGGAVLEFGRQ